MAAEKSPVTLTELTTTLSNKAGLSRRQAADAVNTLLETIQTGLKKGRKVYLGPVGTLSVTKRKARNGRNPKTGESLKIAAKKVVRFRQSSRLSV